MLLLLDEIDPEEIVADGDYVEFLNEDVSADYCVPINVVRIKFQDPHQGTLYDKKRDDLIENIIQFNYLLATTRKLVKLTDKVGEDTSELTLEDPVVRAAYNITKNTKDIIEKVPFELDKLHNDFLELNFMLYPEYRSECSMISSEVTKLIKGWLK